MLRELLRTFRVRSHPAARRLGLVREHAAIFGRYGRVRSAWTPHLQHSRHIILDAARRCSRRETAWIIGAGDCLDVPVEELARDFQRVVLADVVVSPVARVLERRNRGRVVCQVWDATGALTALAAWTAPVSADQIARIFTAADPEILFDAEPDLVVSANCLSQLGLIPASCLTATQKGGSSAQNGSVAAAKRHLAWLARRAGTRVLLADMARVDVSADGTETWREDLAAPLGLRAPDACWRWDIAPIPEFDPDFHRVHEVGAWVD